uniref:CD59 glycoprotein-like n=1 Tax=Geotrypetes seraphini TaxID=260995 RepID=A0A6P8NVS5_GEOSA|nr:CD59 glycoprotein-like [Geotrypetes seraphini]
MKTFIIAAFLAILGISSGDRLQCYHCDVCTTELQNKTTVCSDKQMCVISKAKDGEMVKRGCLDSNKCKTYETIAQASYYHHCCEKDLCNSGHLAQLSLLGCAIVAGLWLQTLL